MAIEIKYKNSLGVEVSAQQVNPLQGDYSTEHYVDDVLQKIDIYQYRELSGKNILVDPTSPILFAFLTA